ncbi:MAG: hypothetical protein WCC69_10760, partial [Pirellulales bacterium]
LPIHKLWGPAIPREMVKGETERVFYDSVDALFPAAVEKRGFLSEAQRIKQSGFARLFQAL